MNTVLNLTQLLFASVAVCNPDDRDLTTSHGVPALALQKLVSRGVLPDWATKLLHFTEGQNGFVCIEWPEIEEFAQELNLTEEPNSTYKRTRIKMSEGVALRQLWKLDIDENTAKKIGLAFKTAIEESEVELAKV